MEWPQMDEHELIDELIAREGGYVNNPADRGGATRSELPKRLPAPTAIPAQ